MQDAQRDRQCASSQEAPACTGELGWFMCAIMPDMGYPNCPVQAEERLATQTLIKPMMPVQVTIECSLALACHPAHAGSRQAYDL